MKSQIVCVSLAIGLVLAQESPPGPRTQNNQEQNLDSTDEPQPSELPDSGPSILSRDNGATVQPVGKLLDLRFYADITGVYDSGLTPVEVNAQASSTNAAGYGVEAGFGLVGSRKWEHDQLSVEYRGRFREYANDTLLNGTDQFLKLGYRHDFQRHLALNLKETAGTTTLANGEFAYLPLTNADLFALPSNELFDNRTNYLESQADLTWDKTAQLSFEAGGEGFVVRRDSLALAGLNGYTAHANVVYRLTRHQTISAGFKYTSFDFERIFGGAALETAAIEYAVELGRHLDLALEAGGSRVDARGLTVAPIDPAIAAIIGESVATVTFSRVLYVPELQFQLVRRFRRSSLRLGFSDGVSPGNGVYLTSRLTSATLGYSYIGYRRLTLAANGGYSQLSTIGQTLGRYSNLEAGGAMTYRIAGDTHLEIRYDFRHYTTQNSFYKMDSNRVSLGLAYSPGDTPLSIW